jgi:hypothetical protein
MIDALPIARLDTVQQFALQHALDAAFAWQHMPDDQTGDRDEWPMASNLL